MKNAAFGVRLALQFAVVAAAAECGGLHHGKIAAQEGIFLNQLAHPAIQQMDASARLRPEGEMQGR